MSSKVKSCEVLNNINTDFRTLSPALQDSIKKIVEKERLTQHEVIVKDFDTGVGNFNGKLYEITINCVKPKRDKDINLFVKEKVIFKNLTTYSVEKIYENENFVYKDLSEVFTYLQDQANVPPEERFKTVQAYEETSVDAIILEHLGPKGFTTYNKEDIVPLKFFELAVQELAKYHALSFVIDKKLPEYFKEKITVRENLINFDEDWKELMRNIFRYVADLYNDQTKTRIEKFLPVLLEKLPKCFKEKASISTLSHGDYRINNVMVRFTDNEPVEVVPVDYQFITYGCPMRDFLYLLFTETDREFRRKHLNDLKELYFETMTRFLTYFDMDVETVYPRKEFDKIYTEWLDFGLMMTLFISVYLITTDTGLDVENLNSSEFPYCPNKVFDERLKGLVDDFVQWGYL